MTRVAVALVAVLVGFVLGNLACCPSDPIVDLTEYIEAGRYAEAEDHVYGADGRRLVDAVFIVDEEQVVVEYGPEDERVRATYVVTGSFMREHEF